MLSKEKSSVFTAISAALKAFINKRINVWLIRRIPQGCQQQINYRNIFIMPTRFGACFVLFMLLLFLLGTNYQNNVIILLSYLLVSFFIVVLHHSFLNLSGLRFQATQSMQGFVGSKLYFPIVVSSNKARFSIRFALEQSATMAKSQHDKLNSEDKLLGVTLEQLVVGENKVQVPYQVCQRGQYSLGRVLIISEYGFGLFKTWTRLDFAQQITAYPEPVAYAWSAAQRGADSEEINNSVASYQDSFQSGQDEFHQLRHYQLGEPFSRVAWRQVARGQGWLTKQYQQALSAKLQLDFDHLPAGNLEQRLSWLSFAIKDCHEQQIAFSLKLPHQSIAYHHSAQHTLKCLTALACY